MGDAQSRPSSGLSAHVSLSVLRFRCLPYFAMKLLWQPGWLSCWQPAEVHKKHKQTKDQTVVPAFYMSPTTVVRGTQDHDEIWSFKTRTVETSCCVWPQSFCFYQWLVLSCLSLISMNWKLLQQNAIVRQAHLNFSKLCSESSGMLWRYLDDLAEREVEVSKTAPFCEAGRDTCDASTHSLCLPSFTPLLFRTIDSQFHYVSLFSLVTQWSTLRKESRKKAVSIYEQMPDFITITRHWKWTIFCQPPRCMWSVGCQ